jgi:chorismate-pyruvate lyase
MRANALMPLVLIAQPSVTAAVDQDLNDAQIFALVQTLNAQLLPNKSATNVLETWCADHRISASPKIIARPLGGPIAPASAQTRARLKVSRSTRLEYRNVALMCGDVVLSVAQNWYVPERLTPEMNLMLKASQTPFGKVIASLSPIRQTASVVMLWSPSAKIAGERRIPDALFKHRAVLLSQTGLPIAEVVETYQRGVVAFAR